MDLVSILCSVELFEGLSRREVELISRLCKERRYLAAETILTEGDSGDEFFIITEGFIEVVLSESGKSAPHIIVNLGPGQLFGEMSLLDHGRRSASLRAISNPTVVQVITNSSFDALCEQNHHIGYIVMRNLAADLSFKLRHRNLAGR